MNFPINPFLTGPAALLQLIDAMLWGMGEYINKHLPAPLGGLFWNRVRRLGQRLVVLAEKARAGTLKPLRPRVRPAGPRAPSASPRVVDQFSRRRGWILYIGGQIASVARHQLQKLLAEDAEIIALIAAEPVRCGRILRPLIRMLDVKDVPMALMLPPRVRAQQGPAAPEAVSETRREPPPPTAPMQQPPPPPPPPEPSMPQPQAGWAFGSFDPEIAILNAFSPFRK